MDLTIIIPTIDNRERILNKVLEYYKNLNCKIIIVDGGVHKKNFDKFLNVKYFKLSRLSFEKRLIFAIKKSNTKYVLTSQDDDFVNLSLVKKGIKFLNKNKSYSWVGGNQVFFKNYFDIYLLKTIIENRRINFNASKDIVTRVFYFFENQPQLFASLFRKQDILNSLKNYLRLVKNKKNNLFELPYSLFMSFNGCYYHFNDLWQFRNEEISNTSTQANSYEIYISRSINFISKKKFKNLFLIKKLKKVIFNKLKKKISYKDFETLFNLSVDRRYEKNKKTDYFNNKYLTFKLIMIKNLGFIFYYLKMLKYFINFFYYLFKNLAYIKFNNEGTKKEWIKIKRILSNI